VPSISSRAISFIPDFLLCQPKSLVVLLSLVILSRNHESMASPSRSSVSSRASNGTERIRHRSGIYPHSHLLWAWIYRADKTLIRSTAMSDVSDLAPLPSSPSQNGDHPEMDATSPRDGGEHHLFFINGIWRTMLTFICLVLSEIDLNSPLNYGTPSSLSSLRTPRSGGRATPMRQRPDVKSDRKLRQVNLAGPTEVMPKRNPLVCSIHLLFLFIRET